MSKCSFCKNEAVYKQVDAYGVMISWCQNCMDDLHERANVVLDKHVTSWGDDFNYFWKISKNDG